MGDLTRAVRGQIPAASIRRSGWVRGLDPFVVEVDGAEMDAVDATGGALALDERVLVTIHAGTVWADKTLAPRPQQGVVAAIDSGLAAVTSDGATYLDVPVIVGTPTVGDTVALVWGSSGLQAIAGGSTAAPASPYAAGEIGVITPAGEAAGAYEDAQIDARATAVRTSRSGAYRTDRLTKTRAYQGHFDDGISADNSGWFFYGAALRAAGTATGCTIRLVRPSDTGSAGSVTIHLRLHTSATVGTTPPSVTADAEKTTTLAWGGTRVVDLGAAWGQKLLDGDASGIALIYSGTTDYASLIGPTDSAPLAGQLRIDYRRKV